MKYCATVIFAILTAISLSAASDSRKIEGVLEPGDKNFEDGTLIDTYQIALEDGQSLAAKIQSDDFESSLILATPDGKFTDMQARSRKGGPASAVKWVVGVDSPQKGSYSLIVAAQKPGEGGQYTLEVFAPTTNLQAMRGPGGGALGEMTSASEGNAEEPPANPAKPVTVEVAGLGKVDLPATAFIDEGLSQSFGQKTPKDDGSREMIHATGSPNEKQFVLGKGGEATWKFTDNFLLDREGPDLLIWQSDGNETFEVWVSADGRGYTNLGEYNGNGAIPVDLNGKFDPGEELVYVRLIDTSLESNAWPGPDIDAIAAIHGGDAPVALEFETAEGDKVTLKMGTVSFVDESVSHDFGERKPKENAIDPQSAVGPPNYEGDDEDGLYYSLGAKGQAVWKFTDNSLINGPGDDLLIFEIGGYEEPVKVEISSTGENWLLLGEVVGATSSIDIGPKASPGTEFFFVRLTDLGKEGGDWPGADIDAIAAIHGKSSQGEGQAAMREESGESGGGEDTQTSPGADAGWIHNKLEDGDATYAGGEYRKDVFVIPLKVGDVLGAQIVTEEFVPEIMSGWSSSKLRGPRSDGHREEPDNEAAISLVGALQSGDYHVVVLSEHAWKPQANWNYKIRFNVNGRILEAPEGITSEGEEGSGAVTVDSTKFAALTPPPPPSGGGGENAPGMPGREEASEYRTNDGVKIRVSADGFVDRYSLASKYVAKNEANAIGKPDGSFAHTQKDGSGVWEFVDNRLVDGAGIDLAIFNAGNTGQEPYRVEISQDGDTWRQVAESDGGIHGIDISHGTPTGETWRYVKIVDLSGGGGVYPGPDIDAIGAVNSQSYEPEIFDLIQEENRETSEMSWKKMDRIDSSDEIGHYEKRMDYYRVDFSDSQLAALETIEIEVHIHPNYANAVDLHPAMDIFHDWRDQELHSFSNPNLTPEVTDGGLVLKTGWHKNSIKGPFYIAVYPDANPAPREIPEYVVSVTGKTASGEVALLEKGEEPELDAESPGDGSPEKIEVEVLGFYFPLKPDGQSNLRGNEVEFYGTMSVNAFKVNPSRGKTTVVADGNQPARIIDQPRRENYSIRVDSAGVTGTLEVEDHDAPVQSSAFEIRQKLLGKCQQDLKIVRTFTVPDSCRNGTDDFVISLRSHFSEKDLLEKNDDTWGYNQFDINLSEEEIWTGDKPYFGQSVHDPDDMMPLFIYFVISRPGTIVENTTPGDTVLIIHKN